MLRASYVAALLLPALPSIATAADVRAVALVLDASGSMNESLPDGVKRMEAAKLAVAKLVSTLPGETRLAFRAYGHQSPTKDKDCKDTALLSPFDSVSQIKNSIVAKANALVPQGYTPISFSLQEAAKDLIKEEATSHTIVLVSDGKETCPGDPCAVAKALAEANAKLVIHTVGVGVDRSTREQLSCISKAARGMYQDAANTAELEKVVTMAAKSEAVEIVRAPALKSVAISAKKPGAEISAPAVIDLSEIVRGRINHKQNHFWRIEAPAGKYRVVLDAKRPDDTHGTLIIGVSGSAGDGEKGFVSLSDNQYRMRGVAEIQIPSGGVTLRVGDTFGLLDYWLAVMPVDAEIAVPYFAKTPNVIPVELGKSAVAVLSASEPEAWFSTELDAKDYKVTAEFTRTDQATSLSAYLSMLGSFGEHVKGPSSICSVTDNLKTATCTSKLVVAQDGPATLRLTAHWKGDYKVTFKLAPIE